MNRQVWLEIAIMFAIVSVINFLWAPYHPGFSSSELHPYLLPVLVIAARHGVTASLLCSAVGTVLLLGLSQLSPNSVSGSVRALGLMDLLSRPQNLVLASWILLGTCVGAVVEAIKRDRSQILDELLELRIIHEELRQRNEILDSENINLRETVLGKTDSMASVYEMARRLTTLEGQDLYQAALELVEKFVGAERCSIYLLDNEDRAFRLVEERGEKLGSPLTEVARGDALMELCLRRAKIVSVRDLFSAQRAQQKIAAVLAAPLGTDLDKPLGVLLVEKLPLEDLNSETISTFELLADWVSRSLGLVQRFQVSGDDTTSDLSAQLTKKRLSNTAIQTLRQYAPTQKMGLRLLQNKDSAETARWNAAQLLTEVSIQDGIIPLDALEASIRKLLERGEALSATHKSLPVRRDFTGCQGLRLRLEERMQLNREAFSRLIELLLKAQHTDLLDEAIALRNPGDFSQKSASVASIVDEVELFEDQREALNYTLGLSRPPRLKRERREILMDLMNSPDAWTRRFALMSLGELDLHQDPELADSFISSDSVWDRESGYHYLKCLDPYEELPLDSDAEEPLRQARERYVNFEPTKTEKVQTSPDSEP